MITHVSYCDKIHFCPRVGFCDKQIVRIRLAVPNPGYIQVCLGALIKEGRILFL